MLHLYQVGMHISKKQMEYETYIQLLQYCNVPQYNEHINVFYLSMDLTFTFLFILFLLDFVPRELACGCIMPIYVAANIMEIKFSSLMTFTRRASLILVSMSSSTPLPLEESCV